jgi:hypothetical protein
MKEGEEKKKRQTQIYLKLARKLTTEIEAPNTKTKK